jgi:hypothetical protein
MSFVTLQITPQTFLPAFSAVIEVDELSVEASRRSRGFDEEFRNALP